MRKSRPARRRRDGPQGQARQSRAAAKVPHNGPAGARTKSAPFQGFTFHRASARLGLLTRGPARLRWVHWGGRHGPP
eukprot:9374824-Lingulodinium_polyedra.AAC.1